MSDRTPLPKDDDSDSQRIVRKTLSPDAISAEVVAVHLENLFAQQKKTDKKVDRLLEENINNREGLAAIDRRVTDVEKTTSWAWKTALTGAVGAVGTLIAFIISFAAKGPK